MRVGRMRSVANTLRRLSEEDRSKDDFFVRLG